jgi:Na+-translocating ferredoxin:NAD+ oxidoreductase RnfC subunit
MQISERIRSAGVVGSGGAGFPAHVKASASVEFVIANGAECEPLLHKDFELMLHYPQRVVDGVKLLMQATGAQTGIINNVETLYNISAAAEGVPVIEKFITVSGAVNNPITFVAPVGLSYRDAIAIAGGASVDSFGVFVSGIMMGKLEFDLDLPITKTCAGLIVLPLDHTLVQRKSLPLERMHGIGKSACDQCSYCTELCPRYTLGYDVQPHKVMRSLSFTATGEDIWNQYAQLCCGCGLCTLYACPEALFPKEACDKGRHDLKEKGIKWEGPMDVSPHPMYEYRRTPLKQLIQRLGIEEYDAPTPFQKIDCRPASVSIPVSQHIGAPAQPVVSVGQSVSRGELIADIPGEELGARLHASISGVVRAVGASIVIASE